MATENTDGAMFQILQWVVSAAAGALFTLVAFRTRFVVIEMKLDQRKTAIDDEAKARQAAFEKVEAEVMAKLAAIDRRSMMTLRIAADIAKKVGIDQRMSDTLVRFLTEEGLADRSPRED
jgi:transposase